MSRTENETVPGETLGIARRRSLVIRATIGDGIGRQDEVARSLALLETEADKLPDSLTTQSQVAYVRGLVALSRGDSKQAVSHFGRCIAQHVYCKWRQIQAFEKSGKNLTRRLRSARLSRLRRARPSTCTCGRCSGPFRQPKVGCRDASPIAAGVSKAIVNVQFVTREEKPATAVSGRAMDRVVPRRRASRCVLGAAMVFIASTTAPLAWRLDPRPDERRRPECPEGHNEVGS